MGKRKPTKCTGCGTKRVVRITYGFPGPELIEKSQAGEVVLGGCVITDDSPEFACLDCDYDFGPGEMLGPA